MPPASGEYAAAKVSARLLLLPSLLLSLLWILVVTCLLLPRTAAQSRVLFSKPSNNGTRCTSIQHSDEGVCVSSKGWPSGDVKPWRRWWYNTGGLCTVQTLQYGQLVSDRQFEVSIGYVLMNGTIYRGATPPPSQLVLPGFQIGFHPGRVDNRHYFPWGFRFCLAQSTRCNLTEADNTTSGTLPSLRPGITAGACCAAGTGCPR